MLRCRQGPAPVASARSRGSSGETLDAIRLAHNDRAYFPQVEDGISANFFLHCLQSLRAHPPFRHQLGARFLSPRLA
jgi:hypothetical protein